METTATSDEYEDIASSLIVDQEDETSDVEENAEYDTDAEGQDDYEDDQQDDEAEEADDEQYDDEDAEEADEEPKSELFTVKVDGVEQQVTLDELRRGYSGQQYVQQQMRDVAENRKTLEAMYVQMQQEAQQISALRQKLETGNIPQMPVPPSKELFEQDPIGYMEAKIKFEEDVQNWQQTMGEMEAVNQRQQEMRQQAMQYQLAEEFQRLQEAIPEFGDAEKGPKLRQAIVQAGMEYGLSPEELSSVADSRHVRVLHDAMKYRELMAARGEVQRKVEKARPVVKAGAKKSANAGKAGKAKNAASRMKRTGSVDDVANFLLS